MKLFYTYLLLFFIINNAAFGQSKNEKPKLDNCEQVINEKQQEFWNLLANFQKKYLANEEGQKYTWNYDFSKNIIEVLKNDVPYLKIHFIHVGSIAIDHKKWTWAYKAKDNKLEKVKEYGLDNNCKKLINSSWKGLEKDAWQMVAISNYILNAKGGTRHYTLSKYDYVIFTKIENIN